MRWFSSNARASPVHVASSGSVVPDPFESLRILAVPVEVGMGVGVLNTSGVGVFADPGV